MKLFDSTELDWKKSLTFFPTSSWVRLEILKTGYLEYFGTLIEVCFRLSVDQGLFYLNCSVWQYFFFQIWSNTSLRITRIIVSFSFLWSLTKNALTCPGEQWHGFPTFRIGFWPQYSVYNYCLPTKTILFGSSSLEDSVTRGELIAKTTFLKHNSFPLNERTQDLVNFI